MDNIPKIGIALGSGAAKGLAHIGVLKALVENNIKLDMVAGCSAGALIGGLYCSGISPCRIRGIAKEIDRKLWVDLTVPKRGFIKGEKIEEIIRLLTRNRSIEDLGIPFAAVATDLIEGRQYVFRGGPLHKAIRASISIPGVFIPVRLGNMVLVDGAVTDRVPVSVLRKMGADIIIAVDVGYGSYSGRLNHIFDVILQSIDVMADQIVSSKIIHADILIKPEVSHVSPSKFHLVDECTEIGYSATINVMKKIKEIIKNYKK